LLNDTAKIFTKNIYNGVELTGWQTIISNDSTSKKR